MNPTPGLCRRPRPAIGGQHCLEHLLVARRRVFGHDDPEQAAIDASDLNDALGTWHRRPTDGVRQLLDSLAVYCVV